MESPEINDQSKDPEGIGIEKAVKDWRSELGSTYENDIPASSGRDEGEGGVKLTTDKAGDGEEVDTCRICRGEGSQEEPLFYPCKCSGSIKFVHQSCLVEWLSHSQKKHCELCKTHFRFTKLYHPHMPNTVPIPIFFRQAALHTWKTLLTWSRFQLVVFVWILWLPWCTRTIWRGLFWIGDGAWVDKTARVSRMSHESEINGTWLFGNTTIGSRNATATAFLGFFSRKVAQALESRSLNYEPVRFKFMRSLYGYFRGIGSSNSTSGSRGGSNSTSGGVLPRSSTWLSDVSLLRNLTRSTTINNIVIDTLEGQLITIFIVTAFILIFLIREWVMQQQQNLVIGPDGNVQEPEGPDIAQIDQQQPAVGAAEQGGPEHALRDNPVEGPGNANRPRGPGARRFARPRLRMNRPPQQEDNPRRESSQGAATALNNLDQPLDRTEHSTAAREEPVDVFDGILGLKEEDMDNEVDPDCVETRQLFNNLLLTSEQFRRVWIRSGYDISEAVTMTEAENQERIQDGVLEVMKRLERSPYLHPERSQKLRPQVRAEQLIRNIENQNGNTSSSPELTPSASSVSAAKESAPADDRRSWETDDYAPDPGMAQSNTEVSEDGGMTLPQVVTPTSEQDDRLDVHLGSQNSKSSLPEKNHGDQSRSKTIDEYTKKDKEAVVDVTRTIHEDHVQAGPSSAEEQGFGGIKSDEAVSATSNNGGSIGNASDEETSGVVPEPEDHDRTIASQDADLTSKNQTNIEMIKDWLWGGVELPPGAAEMQAGDEEHVVNNIADEAPFVPVAHGQHMLQPPNDENNEAQDADAQDPEVVAAAQQAGLDPNGADVVDEMEDLEGIMELVGMEGPLIGLVQNGMFFAILVSLTITFGLWVPYIFGKILLIVLASPLTISIGLLRLASTSIDIVTDLTIFVLGCALYWLDTIINIGCSPAGWLLPPLKRFTENTAVADVSKAYAERAVDRLAKSSIVNSDTFVDGFDIPTVSALAHESLFRIESQVASILKYVFNLYSAAFAAVANCSGFAERLTVVLVGIAMRAKALVSICVENVLTLASSDSLLSRLNPLNFNLAASGRDSPLDYELTSWNGTDRTIAIISGYFLFALLGMLYLKVAASIQGTNKKGTVEGNLASILYQAGGVVKVILIISIEMLLFPLYCGILLDIALLPLFDNATFLSRVEFTLGSPWTSMFIHWFVGTCYMFHFALFVSMCRKIMRTGVLYFIRDPDDPTVHPVRDVLERNVSTQLWKISLSALVCGGLVLAGLGVVWGIGATFKGLFPIHWSSNEPVLEFPVDLLFYNFLMPVTVRAFKPSKGLKKVYGWWFRKCARLLRLSNFLFDDKREDEEGQHVRQTWKHFLRGERGDVEHPVIGEDRIILARDRNTQTYFLRNGRYVRAPASDSVRIPAGASAFVEVDVDNNRIDGLEDKDEGLHGRTSTDFKKVYVPPHFRLRITTFIFLVWLFAAATGICVTIIPLLFGRWVFSMVTPNHLRMNDVYAFTIGVYVLGSVVYALLNYQRFSKYLKDNIIPTKTTIQLFVNKTWAFALRTSKFIYTYAAFGLFLPFIFSLVLEFYIIIPLHTYLSQQNHEIPNSTSAQPNTFSSPAGESLASTSRLRIHLIQDWVLGVLYVKVFARVILWTAPSRPAQALRGIIRNGWFNPDARLATRAFILPATLVMMVVIAIPLGLGWTANRALFSSQTFNAINTDTTTHQTLVYRYSYPAVLAFVALGVTIWGLGKAFKGWKRKVRDEVYLIGERLHNFGEGRKKKTRPMVKNVGKGKERAD